MIDINLKGTFMMNQAFLPHMNNDKLIITMVPPLDKL